MPDELPTIPPHVIQQLKVIVEAVTGVPTDRIDLIATVHEVDGKPEAHLGISLDGRLLSEEEANLLNEILADAIKAGQRIAEAKTKAPFAPTKTLKDIQ